jgi:putative transposase
LWARGYFCATVGSDTEETIRKYIESQELSNKDDIFKLEECGSFMLF